MVKLSLLIPGARLVAFVSQNTDDCSVARDAVLQLEKTVPRIEATQKRPRQVDKPLELEGFHTGALP